MNREVGQKGEAIAARYYRQRGYLLLGHNYRTRMGELDLILYKEDLIVFAEVKNPDRTYAGCACGGGGSVQAKTSASGGGTVSAEQSFCRSKGAV